MKLLELIDDVKSELFIAFIAIAALLTFVPVFTYAYFVKDLQSKESIMNRNSTGLTLLDRKDRRFFVFYEGKNKTFVPLSQIPRHMQKAVIAVEDREFYLHPGFSVRGIIRAIVEDVKQGEIVYGGSTLTQQLVKNALLKPQKSFLRKYQELVLAYEIERRFTKDEILEMYLNSVYFGKGAFGVEEAALAYFNKNAKDLTLSEASYLAGLLPAPSGLSSGALDQAKFRQKIVLEKLFEQGYILKDEKEKAEKEELVFVSGEKLNVLAPHFAVLVRDKLIEQFGEEYVARSGFTVKTTIDLKWQEYAEQVVREQVTRLSANRVTNAATVVLDPKTGEVLAMVGSVDWQNDAFGKVNVALSPRPPGSAFKPIVYVAGFEERLITPATVLRDAPTTFAGGYRPQNFDRRFRGSVLLRRALANSLNVPSVEVMSKVGVSKTLEMANRLGITTLKDPSLYGLSLVLGAGEVKLLELTNAYAVFANSGIKNEPTLMLEVEDKFGKTLSDYTKEAKKTEKILDPTITFLISSILSDTNARREVFGSALDISKTAAVKTGTTEDFRDSWTIGYTPSLAVGVWVGNNDNSPMDNVAGSLGAAPIWRALMERFLTGVANQPFLTPQGVVGLSVCNFNGLIAKEATTSAYTEYFISGTQPQDICVIPKPSPPPPPSPAKPEENKEAAVKKEENNNKSQGENKEKENKERNGND